MIKTSVYKEDVTLSISIFLFFFIQTINGSIKLFFDMPSSLHSLLSSLFGAIYVIYFILKALPIVFKREKKILLISVLLFIFLYSISILLISARGEKLDWLFNEFIRWTFAFWIPVGVSAYSIINYKTLYDVLIKYSFYLTLIFVFVFVKSILFMSEEQVMFYNMFFSYLILIPTLLHLSYYLHSKKKIFLFFSILEISMVLLIGARGAVISILSYILIKLLISKKSISLKITSFILIAFTLFTVYNNLDKVNGFLIENYGVRSRSLSVLSKIDSNQFSSREIAWKSGLKLIEEKPFFGYGLGGGFYPMIQMTGVLSITGDKINSSHNGLIELMIEFGIPIGLTLGILLILSIIRIKSIYSFTHREILIIMFVIYVLPSMTVGDGIVMKPAIAIYIYMIMRKESKKQLLYQ